MALCSACMCTLVHEEKLQWGGPSKQANLLFECLLAGYRYQAHHELPECFFYFASSLAIAKADSSCLKSYLYCKEQKAIQDAEPNRAGHARLPNFGSSLCMALPFLAFNCMAVQLLAWPLGNANRCLAKEVVARCTLRSAGTTKVLAKRVIKLLQNLAVSCHPC